MIYSLPSLSISITPVIKPVIAPNNHVNTLPIIKPPNKILSFLIKAYAFFANQIVS